MPDCFMTGTISRAVAADASPAFPAYEAFCYVGLGILDQGRLNDYDSLVRHNLPLYENPCRGTTTITLLVQLFAAPE
jgi:hypothetical protein